MSPLKFTTQLTRSYRCFLCVAYSFKYFIYHRWLMALSDLERWYLIFWILSISSAKQNSKVLHASPWKNPLFLLRIPGYNVTLRAFINIIIHWDMTPYKNVIMDFSMSYITNTLWVKEWEHWQRLFDDKCILYTTILLTFWHLILTPYNNLSAPCPIVYLFLDVHRSYQREWM